MSTDPHDLAIEALERVKRKLCGKKSNANRLSNEANNPHAKELAKREYYSYSDAVRLVEDEMRSLREKKPS